MFTFPPTILSKSSISIPFDSLGGFDILYYLGTNSNTTSFTNPSNSGVIETTSIGNFSGVPSLVTSRTNTDYFTIQNSMSWVTFNFKLKSINPNYYVIKNRNGDSNHSLRNWKLQGSNDNSTWTDLDTRTNNTSLNATNQFVGFSCISNTFYSYIRLLQTGFNSSFTEYLAFGGIYFYGDLNI